MGAPDNGRHRGSKLRLKHTMALLNRLWTTFFRSSSRERRIAEELAFHIDERTAENIAAGMNAAEARLDAQRRFRSLARLGEETRDVSILEWADILLRDIRLACRSLWRRPGLAATILASLALGIGATSAIFSVVDAVLLRPFHLADPGRVFSLDETRHGPPAHNSNPARLADWARQSASLAAVYGFYGEGLTLTGQGAPERIRTWRTVGDPLTVLGVQPFMGRGFTEHERQGLEPVALLDYKFWKNRFNGDAQVLGRSLTLGGRAFIVVGVLPADFDYPGDIDAWIPAGPEVQTYSRRASFLGGVARLRSGALVSAAQAELDTVSRRLQQQYPATDSAIAARLTPLRESVTHEARKPLLILLATVGFVLLMACVNTASLLLARSSERSREAAIRVALGAGTGSLIRLYLIESLVLAACGGGLGIVLASLSVDALVRLLPADLPRTSGIHLDLRVVAVSFAASLFCGLLFGLVPALQAARFSSRLRAGYDRLWTRRLLVVSQVALSAILLVGVGLLAKSLFLLLRTPLGFEPAQITTVQINLPWDTEATVLQQFYTRTLDALSEIPGVRSAGVIDRLPLQGGAQSGRIAVRGATLPPDLKVRAISYRGTSPGYFSALGIPLEAGRLLRDSREMVVNDALARRFFPDGRALGQYITFDVDPESRRAAVWYRVVGIVGNVRQEPTQAAPVPEAFLAMRDVYWPMANFVLRTDGNVNAAIRSVLSRVNPDQVVRISSLDRELNATVREPRVRVWLVGSFALAALLLAAIGVYGLLASDVTQRTQEIGLRMALGADPRSILRSVVRRAFKLVIAGLALGILGAAVLTRFLQSVLYAVATNDIAVFAWAVVILFAVAFSAAYLPAMRAAGIAPAVALRHE